MKEFPCKEPELCGAPECCAPEVCPDYQAELRGISLLDFVEQKNGLKDGELPPIFITPSHTEHKSMMWFDMAMQHIKNGGSVLFHSFEYEPVHYYSRLREQIDACPMCAAGIPLYNKRFRIKKKPYGNLIRRRRSKTRFRG